MTYDEINTTLKKYGYEEREPVEGRHIFYKFGVLDFLYADDATKFEVDIEDEEVKKVTMLKYITRYGGQYTEIKEIKTLDEIRFYM